MISVTIQVENAAELRQALLSLLKSAYASTDKELEVDLTSVTDLGLMVRTQNCLLAEKITTVGALRAHSAQELLNLPMLGRKSFNEIKEVLKHMGVKLCE